MGHLSGPRYWPPRVRQGAAERPRRRCCPRTSRCRRRPRLSWARRAAERTQTPWCTASRRTCRRPRPGSPTPPSSGRRDISQRAKQQGGSCSGTAPASYWRSASAQAARRPGSSFVCYRQVPPPRPLRLPNPAGASGRPRCLGRIRLTGLLPGRRARAPETATPGARGSATGTASATGLAMGTATEMETPQETVSETGTPRGEVMVPGMARHTARPMASRLSPEPPFPVAPALEPAASPETAATAGMLMVPPRMGTTQGAAMVAAPGAATASEMARPLASPTATRTLPESPSPTAPALEPVASPEATATLGMAMVLGSRTLPARNMPTRS